MFHEKKVCNNSSFFLRSWCFLYKGIIFPYPTSSSITNKFTIRQTQKSVNELLSRNVSRLLNLILSRCAPFKPFTVLIDAFMIQESTPFVNKVPSCQVDRHSLALTERRWLTPNENSKWDIFYFPPLFFFYSLTLRVASWCRKRSCFALRGGGLVELDCRSSGSQDAKGVRASKSSRVSSLLDILCQSRPARVVRKRRWPPLTMGGGRFDPGGTIVRTMRPREVRGRVNQTARERPRRSLKGGPSVARLLKPDGSRTTQRNGGFVACMYVYVRRSLLRRDNIM